VEANDDGKEVEPLRNVEVEDRSWSAEDDDKSVMSAPGEQSNADDPVRDALFNYNYARV
jgi:hypothetical protein